MKIYCGRQSEGQYKVEWTVAQVVKRMARHIEGTCRNITTDNYFTIVPLAMELLEKKPTIIGTIRKNKIQLPPEFVVGKNRQLNSSLFGF